MYGHRMMYFLPGEKLEYETIRTCPFCGAGLDGAEVLDTEALYLHDLCNGVVVVRCERCGSVMQRTRLAPSQWKQFNDSYPSDGSHGWDGRAERFENEMRLILNHVAPGGSILDVGCGFGELTKLLKDRGYESEGIDPRGDALVYGREAFGLRLHDGFYDPDTSSRLGERFHGVVSVHVFEHFTDPMGTLALMRENLIPGGLLLLTVPDVEPVQGEAGIKPFDFYTPGHLFYYQASTLASALLASGFDVLCMERGFDPSSEKPVLLAAAKKMKNRAAGTEPRKPATAEEIEQFQAQFILKREKAVVENLSLNGAKDVAVYGTWLYGLITLHGLERAGYRVVKVVDSDPGKWGHLFSGHVISAPAELKTLPSLDAVAVTSIQGFDQICRTIRTDLGLAELPVRSIAGSMIH